MGVYSSWLKDERPVLAVHVRREEDDMIVDERKEIADESTETVQHEICHEGPQGRKIKCCFLKVGGC